MGRRDDECIIALKVYDQCRQQDCLTPEMLDRVFSLESGECVVGDQIIAAGRGSIINLPVGAVDIAVKDFKISKIETDRKQDVFNPDYYFVHVKYFFKFKLSFLDGDGCPIAITCDGVERDAMEAGTAFKKTVKLYGSEGSDIAISSNLFAPESHVLEAAPYVLVEAKAMLLDAQIDTNDGLTCECGEEAIGEINLTIGLFTIIKLYRLVNLLVESSGFCEPEECDEVASVDPCSIFENMDFPFDIFNPPQKNDARCGRRGSGSDRDDYDED